MLVTINSRYGIRSYLGCYDSLSYPLFFPSGELGWHMDIPKKGVTMEDVNMARALRKARSGTEEEEEIGLFIFLYFSCMSNRYPRNTSNTIVFL